MSYYYEYELGKAAKILCEDLFKLKQGEIFIITADTECEKRVVDATATAAFACDAKPMVIYTASPLGIGKDADTLLPLESLTAALLKADAWVEFNNKELFCTTAYEIAMKDNKKLRYLSLSGMNVDMMVRDIGRIDYFNLEQFLKLITQKTLSTKHMRITTPGGTDIEFDNEPSHNILMYPGYADTPGSYLMAGTIIWSPNFDSVNGTIVFDGSIVPPIVGILKEPVRLTIKKGEIVRINGGKEAIDYNNWLKSFDHPQILKLAHVSYGFNPGARLTGNLLEDAKVWGATEWGFGNVRDTFVSGGIYGPSHSDGICLNSSVWLDGIQIMDKGQIIHPELKKYAEKLGKV